MATRWSLAAAFALDHSAASLNALTKCADAISGRESLTPEAPPTMPAALPAPAYPVLPAYSVPQTVPTYPAAPSGLVQVALTDNGTGGLVTSGIVNGTREVRFMLDTGSAMVALPGDVIGQLLADGSLTAMDYVGTGAAVLADGRKVPAVVYRLHSLAIGGYVVSDVLCSVTPPGTEALLGQSFLKKFSSVGIYNAQKTLTLG